MRHRKPYRKSYFKHESTSDADGVDAIKDANAEAGRKWNDPDGFYDAKRKGWLGNDPEDDIDSD